MGSGECTGMDVLLFGKNQVFLLKVERSNFVM